MLADCFLGDATARKTPAEAGVKSVGLPGSSKGKPTPIRLHTARETRIQNNETGTVVGDDYVIAWYRLFPSRESLKPQLTAA